MDHLVDNVQIIPTETDKSAAEFHNITPMQYATADHIEMWHERELAPGGYLPEQIIPLHDKMHTDRTDWGHDHVQR